MRLYIVYTDNESGVNAGVLDPAGIMTTTIQKWGNSQGIRLPKVILEMVDFEENEQVDITVRNDSIIIKKSTRRRRAKVSLAERFENYDGDYQPEEYDWGKPVGREYW